MSRTEKDTYKATLRGDKFASRLTTRIWSEEACIGNPYIAESCRCHGYDLFELVKKCSFIEVLYLLFQGELPTKNQAQLLESLVVGLINPGPRHPATRAAMNAGIGKTDTAHILPIALLTIGGAHLGGAEVVASMRFLNKNYRNDPNTIIKHYVPKPQNTLDKDVHIVPGFGTRFGAIDPISKRLATYLAELPGSGAALSWGVAFSTILENEHGMGWLATGVAAATLADLKFHPRMGAGLFQLMNAPGMLAHGLEMSNKPLTAMPFIDNDHYVIERTNE